MNLKYNRSIILLVLNHAAAANTVTTPHTPIPGEAGPAPTLPRAYQLIYSGLRSDTPHVQVQLAHLFKQWT